MRQLIELVADGIMTARISDGESTWPILRQDDLGKRHARLMAASAIDALVSEGIIDRTEIEAWYG